jgi:hypothetical protein
MRRLLRASQDYRDVLRIASAARVAINAFLALQVWMVTGSAVMVGAGASANDDKSAARPRPPVQGTSAQGTSAQQDKEIETAIRAKLAKSKIGEDGFKVRVQGGVATWEGSTEVVQHKGAATRMAKSAGARLVVNNIKIGDAAKQSAADNLDQGRRRVQIKRSDPRSQ